MKPIALIGEGGHSKVIKDMIRSSNQYSIIASFDDKYDSLKKEDIYYGPLSTIKDLLKEKEFQLVIAIGNNEIRSRISEKLQLDIHYYATVIHPSAIISTSATIGNGTVVMPNTVINADTRIGNHVILNTGAIIEHDNFIADYAHISPNATLTGGVHVGEGTQIGAGAVVIPGKSIGEWSMVGAGSVVIQDIPSCSTAVGSPARVIKQVEQKYVSYMDIINR